MDSDDNTYDDNDDVHDLSTDEEAPLDCHNNDDNDNDFDDVMAESEEDSGKKRENYTILREADIRRLMDDDISKLSTVLSITKHEASILLRHYNWHGSNVHDAWFADESGVRKKVGLLEKPQQISNDTSGIVIVSCGICFESYGNDLTKSATCGHLFCNECWRLYIKTNVNDGPGCLMLRCPEPTCVVAVGEDIINELAFEEDKKKYNRFLSRSYIEDNKRRKWCPAVDCDCAIDFLAGDENFDVRCLCSHTFCWNCCEEPHRPVGCDTVRKWILRNHSESENETWKKAYTKPCPNCKRPIEKNKGCMHMVCSSPCNFSFCWVCLKNWKTHNFGGGTCNRFYEDPAATDEETSLLRKDLLRYQHYYDRWAANEKSRQIALADLQRVQSEHIQEIGCIHGQPEAHLGFLTRAWQQIVDCRRVLKWTYAYGFYLPQNQDAKKQLFEYLQGQAESSLERLHSCAERELKKFLNPDSPSNFEFKQFQEKLACLTSVTKNYFENLVTALENGLSDVMERDRSDTASSLEEENMKRKYSRIIEDTSTLHTTLRRTNTGQTYRRIADNWAPLIAQTGVSSVEQNTLQDPWSCEFCTFLNPGSAMTCEVCLRGPWSCQFCTFANPRTAITCQMCNENR